MYYLPLPACHANRSNRTVPAHAFILHVNENLRAYLTSRMRIINNNNNNNMSEVIFVIHHIWFPNNDKIDMAIIVHDSLAWIIFI